MQSKRLLCAGVLLLLACLALAATSAEGKYAIGGQSLVLQDPRQPDKTIYGIVRYPLNARGAGPFPLLVFSPGYLATDRFYDYLWQALVPTGYVMAVLGTYGWDPISYPTWKARDQAFMLEYLRDQSQSNHTSPLYGLVGNLSTAMGHSEGGVTSLIAADPSLLDYKYKYNFSAVIDLSGCFSAFNFSYAAELDAVPIFVITGTKDCLCWDSWSFRYWAETPSHCKYYADIVDASHCYFASVTEAEDILCWDAEIALGCGFDTRLSEEAQLAKVLAYVTPWLDWQMKGDASARSQLDQLLQSDQANGKVKYSTAC